MPARIESLNQSVGPVRRALRYAFYDWTREMTRRKRVVTWVGILLQGYAFWALWSRSLVWPVIWPKGMPLYASAWLLYVVGGCLVTGMLTSEFVRKTQLESDQIATRQIQETLHPGRLEPLPGYTVETFHKPFRDVGGDYFDVIEVPGNRTLFAVADVSGKGMPAALLAANIQALVRSIANVETDPAALAQQINRHLSRYTPSNRFATAVFIVLNRDSGELRYVNVGHDNPIVFCDGAVTSLSTTGMPLGLFADAGFEARSDILRPGGVLLVFTDGLPDSMSDLMPGENSSPEQRLRDALADRSQATMSSLQSLVNPKFNEDDITILLVKREL